MNKDQILTQQQLDALLTWLSPDRDAAAKIYVSLSEGLERYFSVRGCTDTPALVDKTINRLARKLDTIDRSAGYKPVTYFYGFAKNIYLEHLKEIRRSPIQVDPDTIVLSGTQGHGEDSDPRFRCLRECLGGLGADESSLLTAYYENDRVEKIAARRDLAHGHKITMGNLHIKIHRLKAILRDCLDKCLSKENNL